MFETWIPASGTFGLVNDHVFIFFLISYFIWVSHLHTIVKLQMKYCINFGMTDTLQDWINYLVGLWFREKSYFQSHLIILLNILKRSHKGSLNLNSPVKIIQTIVLTSDFVIFYLIGSINTNDMSA